MLSIQVARAVNIMEYRVETNRGRTRQGCIGDHVFIYNEEDNRLAKV